MKTKTVIERREPESGDYIADTRDPLAVLFAASPHGAANVSSVVLGQQYHRRLTRGLPLHQFTYSSV